MTVTDSTLSDLIDTVLTYVQDDLAISSAAMPKLKKEMRVLLESGPPYQLLECTEKNDSEVIGYTIVHTVTQSPVYHVATSTPKAEALAHRLLDRLNNPKCEEANDLVL